MSTEQQAIANMIDSDIVRYSAFAWKGFLDKGRGFVMTNTAEPVTDEISGKLLVESRYIPKMIWSNFLILQESLWGGE